MGATRIDVRGHRGDVFAVLLFVELDFSQAERAWFWSTLSDGHWSRSDEQLQSHIQRIPARNSASRERESY
jgi:hypothetical protein